MVNFITQNGPIFHKIFKIFVVINQKLCDICGQKLVWAVSTIGTTSTQTFVKIREVTQKFLVDLTQNDPLLRFTSIVVIKLFAIDLQSQPFPGCHL